MKNLERMQVLKDGLNAKALAEAFGCSVGRINELKNEIDIEWLAQEFNLNADELKNKIEKHINLRALESFAIKHEVNLDEIDFESMKQTSKAKAEKIEFTVGMKIGKSEIINVEKVGNTYVYLLKDENGKVYINSKKQIEEAMKA